MSPQGQDSPYLLRKAAPPKAAAILAELPCSRRCSTDGPIAVGNMLNVEVPSAPSAMPRTVSAVWTLSRSQVLVEEQHLALFTDK